MSWSRALLTEFARLRYPDASVRLDEGSNDYLVTLRVSSKSLMEAKHNPRPVLERLREQLRPHDVRRRKLHWMKLHRVRCSRAHPPVTKIPRM